MQQDDKMQDQKTNAAQNDAPKRNDDYKREGTHLGGDRSDTSGSTQKGGGGSGYDVSREQHEVNKEQEIMHNERDNEQLNPERTQTPQPEIDPGKENPGKNPSQPETRPDTSTMGSVDRTASGAWSQSSWDPNSLR